MVKVKQIKNLETSIPRVMAVISMSGIFANRALHVAQGFALRTAAGQIAA